LITHRPVHPTTRSRIHSPTTTPTAAAAAAAILLTEPRRGRGRGLDEGGARARHEGSSTKG
jgi:hypothetical protein